MSPGVRVTRPKPSIKCQCQQCERRGQREWCTNLVGGLHLEAANLRAGDGWRRRGPESHRTSGHEGISARKSREGSDSRCLLHRASQRCFWGLVWRHQFRSQADLISESTRRYKKNIIPDHGGHASEKGRGACHSRRGKHGCACASFFSACTTATVRLWHSAVFGGSICHVSACGMEAGALDGRLRESSTPEFDPNGRIR